MNDSFCSGEIFMEFERASLYYRMPPYSLPSGDRAKTAHFSGLSLRKQRWVAMVVVFHDGCAAIHGRRNPAVGFALLSFFVYSNRL
jgi:hypothetical protein